MGGHAARCRCHQARALAEGIEWAVSVPLVFELPGPGAAFDGDAGSAHIHCPDRDKFTQHSKDSFFMMVGVLPTERGKGVWLQL